MNGRSRSHSVKPYVARVEVGVVRHRVAAERVQVRDEMAAHAVGVDELQDARLLLDGLEAAAAGRERRRRSFSQRIGRCGTFRSEKIRS